MGLDPLFVVGLWGVSFFGLGWLAGPLLGGLGFRVLYGKYAKGMAAVRLLPLLFFQSLPTFSFGLKMADGPFTRAETRRFLCAHQEAPR